MISRLSSIIYIVGKMSSSATAKYGRYRIMYPTIQHSNPGYDSNKGEYVNSYSIDPNSSKEFTAAQTGSVVYLYTGYDYARKEISNSDLYLNPNEGINSQSNSTILSSYNGPILGFYSGGSHFAFSGINRNMSVSSASSENIHSVYLANTHSSKVTINAANYPFVVVRYQFESNGAVRVFDDIFSVNRSVFPHNYVINSETE